ncbi:hypothetical protein ABWH89_13390 [Hoeflea alexandrii]|uniref:hypothetical protein n=1 Tax=Hoeflea alexandrii TaxID=288436 RepID=UPI0035CE9CDB
MIAWGLTGVDEMALIFVRWRGAHPLPIGGGDFEAVAEGQKSENPISVNEGLNATPREGCISTLGSAKRKRFQERGSVSGTETPPHLKNLRLGAIAPRP